jgi:hypothetical protein
MNYFIAHSTKQTEKWRHTRLYMPQLPSTCICVRFRVIYSWLLSEYNLILQVHILFTELFAKCTYYLLASEDYVLSSNSFNQFPFFQVLILLT